MRAGPGVVAKKSNAWERRPQAQFLMGNGTLLATFDPTGEIDQLFAPRIDALHGLLGNFRTSLWLPDSEAAGAQLIRLSPELFEIRLELERGCQVLRSEYRHKTGRFRLERRLGIHPTEPLLIDRWRVHGAAAGLLHESLPWMSQATSAHGSFFHPAFNGLVHYRGERWLGILTRAEVRWAQVGHLSDHARHLLWDGEKVQAPIRPEDLHENLQEWPQWDRGVQGPATWGAFAVEPAQELDFFIICAKSERHLSELLGEVRSVPSSRHFEMIGSRVSRRYAPAEPMLAKITNSRVRELSERSIDVLHALQDAQSGALLAAAEVDPHCKMSGGYGYSWPRDGAYLAAALGAFGFRERVEHHFRFLQDAQDQSGVWWQRYLATGHPGPSWGRIQIDEGASCIVLAAMHYRSTRDLFWLEKTWPMLERGLSFLDAYHPPERPEGLPSRDLWEERDGVHAYSVSAVVAAFWAGAYLARELSQRHAWRFFHRRFRELARVLEERFALGDETLDSSLLGLITPFGLLGKRDPMASRLVDQVRDRLESRPSGGILRYEGDTYRGGNPWVLTTLWLGHAELILGRTRDARSRLEWVMSKATGLGMLAEQVHREKGHPYWVIPLGWSHAMFLLFVREVLERGLQKEIW